MITKTNEDGELTEEESENTRMENGVFCRRKVNNNKRVVKENRRSGKNTDTRLMEIDKEGEESIDNKGKLHTNDAKEGRNSKSELKTAMKKYKEEKAESGESDEIQTKISRKSEAITSNKKGVFQDIKSVGQMITKRVAAMYNMEI